MDEIAKLYLTGMGIIKGGIISLTNNNINVYTTKKVFSNDLRGKLFYEIKLKDIIHITSSIRLLGIGQKTINIFPREETWNKLQENTPKLIKSFISLTNTEKKIELFVNADSRSEIETFVKKANELIEKQKQKVSKK